MAKKRGYSDEFPTTRERRVSFMLDKIPPALWIRVKAKAKREGVSLRSLILGWCRDWLARQDARQKGSLSADSTQALRDAIADFNDRLTRETTTIIPGLAFASGLLELRLAALSSPSPARQNAKE